MNLCFSQRKWCWNHTSLNTSLSLSLSLSQLLTFILSAGKPELHSYCDTSYSVSGMNYVWILTSSKDILDSAYPFNIFKLFLEYIHTQSRSLSSYNTIKTFVLSISCTNTLHTNLKELVQICFINKRNGQRSFRKRQLYLANILLF